jgi:hypothetical protein
VARCEAFVYLGLHYKPLRPAVLWDMADGAGSEDEPDGESRLRASASLD